MKLKFLGTAQDAGVPQIGCYCNVCKNARINVQNSILPVSLGVYNENNRGKYLFEATPNFPQQYEMLKNFNEDDLATINGIFLTHAHIGHYTGLFYLGKEAFNSKNIKVYVSKKMGDFLINNAPWNQLITNGNVILVIFYNGVEIDLGSNLFVTPYEVPHRNEYADTFSFLITNSKTSSSIFFVPDIDSWNNVIPFMNNIFKKSKYAIIDSTFFTKDEIKNFRNRNPEEIPHPSIEETLKLIDTGIFNLDKCQLVLSHFNHTNLLLHNNKKVDELNSNKIIMSTDGLELDF